MLTILYAYGEYMLLFIYLSLVNYSRTIAFTDVGPTNHITTVTNMRFPNNNSGCITLHNKHAINRVFGDGMTTIRIYNKYGFNSRMNGRLETCGCLRRSGQAQWKQALRRALRLALPGQICFQVCPWPRSYNVNPNQSTTLCLVTSRKRSEICYSDWQANYRASE